MSFGDFAKQALSELPRFVSTFVNVLISPLAYARTTALFDSSKLPSALTFFGIAILVTWVIKAPLMSANVSFLGVLESLEPPVPGPANSNYSTVNYLAADAIWKFYFALAASLSITFSWKIFKGKASAGQHLVATLIYLGVFSIIWHFAMLASYSIATTEIIAMPAWLLWVYIVVVAGALIFWCAIVWETYVEANKSSYVFLPFMVAAVISIPLLTVGVFVRERLLA